MPGRAVAPPASQPVVLKIGGSLLESGRLPVILSIIAGAAVPVAIVPGGGPFADAVRDQHVKLGFGMGTAHRMAMLAMQQMAEIIAEHDPCFQIAETLDAIDDFVEAGDIPIWAPWRLISQDDEVPADWTVTSDALSARLAEMLDGAPLVLLKSVDVAAGVDAEALSREGVVDPHFPVIVKRAKLRWRVLGPSEDETLACLLLGGEMDFAQT